MLAFCHKKIKNYRILLTARARDFDQHTPFTLRFNNAFVKTENAVMRRVSRSIDYFPGKGRNFYIEHLKGSPKDIADRNALRSSIYLYICRLTLKQDLKWH